jgi:hypothetical protein
MSFISIFKREKKAEVMQCVEAVLKEKWMGNPPGSKIRLNPQVAVRLVGQGIINDFPHITVSALNYIRVRFLAEWMGRKPGQEESLVRNKAIELQQRLTVEFIDDDQGEVEVKDMKIEEKEIETEIKKDVDQPEKNKMISKPVVKKGFFRE